MNFLSQAAVRKPLCGLAPPTLLGNLAQIRNVLVAVFIARAELRHLARLAQA
jgi:hypothetical protein